MRIPLFKAVVFILMLAVAGQPLQARACDMATDDHQQTSRHLTDHSGGADSDCCDPRPDSSQTGCAWFMDCGPCSAALSVSGDISRPAFIWPQVVFLEFHSGEIPPSHSRPLYRPPIA